MASIRSLPHLGLGTFKALRHRNYRLYWLGMIVSQTGTWMQTLGQQWLVLQLTNSALWLGIVGFCTSIPILLLSMLAGVLIDRVDKRRLIIVMQVAAMAQALVLALLTASGLVQIWHVVIAALSLGVINAFDRPARQTFVIEMVGKEDLANAIALNSTVFNGARIFGPSLAGILIAIPQVGIAGAFFINSLSFLAVIAGLLMMDVHPTPNTVRSQPWRLTLTEGVNYARSDRVVATLLVMASISSIFGMSYSTMLPIFARDILKVGAQGQGLMMTCVGVGALSGALIVASLAHLHRAGLMWTIGNLLFPPMMLILACSRSFPLTLVALLFLGAGLIVQSSMTNTLLQTSAPDHLRGRVMGLYNLTFSGMMPFGSLQAGIVANVFGAPVAVALGGLICLGRAVWITWRRPDLRALP